MVKSFILAAGYGERLRPITDVIPKSLIPVLNLPSICYAIFLLKEAGINDIICNLHYKNKEMIHFFEKNDFFGLNVSFSIEETILGTGGGIKKCEEWIGDDEFILINSDIVLDINLCHLIDHHRKSSSPSTLVLYETEQADRIGRVGVQNNRVVDFNNIRKTDVVTDFIYTGVAILSPILLNYLDNGFSSVVNTGYVDLINNHSLGYYEHRGFWHDIGTIPSFWHVNIRMMKEIQSLEKRIKGALGLLPHILSPAANISRKALISDSVIGEGVTIGEDVIIEESVILPNSKIDNCRKIRKSVVYPGGVIKGDP